MYDANTWSASWGWFLWFGIAVLLFSSFGNWGYTYRAHRKYSGLNSGKDALDILNERYAKGELNREEFSRMKTDILREERVTVRKIA